MKKFLEKKVANPNKIKKQDTMYKRKSFSKRSTRISESGKNTFLFLINNKNEYNNNPNSKGNLIRTDKNRRLSLQINEKEEEGEDKQAIKNYFKNFDDEIMTAGKYNDFLIQKKEEEEEEKKRQEKEFLKSIGIDDDLIKRRLLESELIEKERIAKELEEKRLEDEARLAEEEKKRKELEEKEEMMKEIEEEAQMRERMKLEEDQKKNKYQKEKKTSSTNKFKKK